MLKTKKISYATFQNILLWLFITSGPIKTFFDFLQTPFNWTFTIFILVVIDITLNIFWRREKIILNKEKLLMSGFLTIMYLIIVSSLLYTKSPHFSFEKTLFFSINVLYFIYPLFITKIDLELLHKLFLYIFLPIVLWFIISKALYFTPYNKGNRLIGITFYEVRRNYLGLGMGLGLLVILQVYLKKSFVLISLTMIFLFGLAARGALIFLLVTLLIWKFKSLLNRILRFKLKKKILKTLTFVFLFVQIIIIYQYEKLIGFLSVGLLRFQSLFEISTDESMLGRVDMLIYTMETIFGSITTFFFGKGIGSFGILYTGEDSRQYPHNVFLEVWFELGIFFLILFVIFIVFPFLLKRKTIFKVFIFYFLLNALKSGDLPGLWLLFFFIGLLVFNPEFKNENIA